MMHKIDLNNFPSTIGPCAICRQMIEAEDADPSEPVEFYRGETLCFHERTLGFWARRTVIETQTQAAKFAWYDKTSKTLGR